MFYQSVKEIRKLLTYLTGNDRQIDSAAGDMYVTIFGGRTRLIGTLLGRGYGIDEALAELKGVTLESLVIIGRINKAVKKLAQDGKLDAAEFPLLCTWMPSSRERPPRKRFRGNVSRTDRPADGIFPPAGAHPVGGSFESPRQTLRIRLRPQIFRKT